jgi:hypothetical protein
LPRTTTIVACLVAIALAGCEQRDRCLDLAKAICAALGVTFERVAPWLDHQLRDVPRLERDEVCALIQREDEVLAGFGEKARTELTNPETKEHE